MKTIPFFHSFWNRSTFIVTLPKPGSAKYSAVGYAFDNNKMIEPFEPDRNDDCRLLARQFFDRHIAEPLSREPRACAKCFISKSENPCLSRHGLRRFGATSIQQCLFQVCCP